MTAVRLVLVEQDTFERFTDAVYALSDAPGPVTLVRYLAASRELEESRPAGKTPHRARRPIALTEGRTHDAERT